MLTYALPDTSYEAYTWLLQDEHGAPTPPLGRGGMMFGAPPPSSGGVPMQVTIHGFRYARPEAAGANPFGSFSAPSSLDDLRRWRSEWLPEVEALATRLDGLDPAAVAPGEWDATLAGQDREFGRVFAGVHLNAVGNGRMAATAFIEAYQAQFGKESRADAYALLQGLPNLSADRAAALWALSRLAREDGAILAALDKGQDLPESGKATRFAELLRDTLARFGATTNIGGMHLATWGEDSSIPLTIARAYARLADDKGPVAAAESQRQRRLVLEAVLKQSAVADEQVAALLPLLELAQQYLPNLEDHNLLCDQRLGAASRARWLRIGHFLEGRGLDSAEDVFFYERAELHRALEGGALLDTGVIAERRRVQAAIAVSPPPPYLGRAPEGRLAPPAPAEAQGQRVIRGAAASAGSYRGRARIIETLEDAGRLEEGDVLVCRTTTPPWTPLFSTIGALVTNAGGALSHGAVVAREFGIPAVVGTTYATVTIPDGATVTVDGSSGTVIVEGS